MNFNCWFFCPVDARETGFGPCVVAAAYAAVIGSARTDFFKHMLVFELGSELRTE